MREQRVRMDAFDRSALLQYHQQAITHALAPQQSHKQMPSQLVFPDDTMAVGAPATSRGGALFATDREDTQESEEERQRRLLQNEPVVVYTSLSDRPLLAPLIAWRGLALMLVIAIQACIIVVVLTGGEVSGVDSGENPTATQAGLYSTQIVLHGFFLLAMYLWNVDLLKAYTVAVTLLFFLILVFAIRQILDVANCALCVPVVVLSNQIRELMMPHCFTVR